MWLAVVFPFCFCFPQSKKTYEVKCREAYEAESAEQTNIPAKNAEKVMYRHKSAHWYTIFLFKAAYLRLTAAN